MKNLCLFLLYVLCSFFVQAQCGSQNYTEPQFTVTVQNPGCPQVGEIRVTSASDGIAPYNYTLLPNNTSNGTGTFTNLSPGTYFIQLKDACGTIRTRQATIVPYNFSSTSTLTPLGCAKFQFDISCSANGPGLEYGYSVYGSGDTTWATTAQIVGTLTPPVNVQLIVRDSCGNTAVSQQYISKETGGYIKVLNERIKCNGQEIYPEYYGFSAPNVCLYKYPQKTLVECKQAPAGVYNGGAVTNFFDLPFGQDYYVIVQDGCYRDSAFFKDKTSAGGSELNPFAWHCGTFDLHSDGNLTDSVCLYNAVTNQLVECKHGQGPGTGGINPNTGKPWPYGGAEFYDLPYGSYYSYIYDPCADTLIRIDTTVRYPYRSSSHFHAVCIVGESVIAVNYNPEAPHPWVTSIYWPNDSLVAVYQSSGSNWMHSYPTFPGSGTIKVITEDGCGKKDTSYINQANVIQPIRRKEVIGGCPGIYGPSGGGDIILHGNAAAYAGINGVPTGHVQIISKDGLPISVPQSYTQFNTGTGEQDFYFSNLSTGVYVLESSVGCTDFHVYDTVQIKPYVYPLQEQMHITQCGANPFVFKDTVTGGLAPFSYEVISTTPFLPSLATGPQLSNTFMIPPGTNLDTVQLQVIDYCGNSHIKTFPVNHLPSCFPLSVGTQPAQDQLQNKSVVVYPNPSRNGFSIVFSQKRKMDYQISLTNAAGIVVIKNIVYNIDKQKVDVNEGLTAGMYFLEITELKSNKKYHLKQVIL